MLEFDEVSYKYDWQHNHLYVDMVLGNTCSYSCSYCPDSLHDGSVPWHSIDNLKKFTSRVLSHYSTNLNKQFYTFNFLGGEPSLYKHLIELCDHVKNESEKYNSTSMIEFLTNGYRKEKWWRQNIHLFDQVNISHHPEFARPEHSRNVADIVAENKKRTSLMVLMPPVLWNECLNQIEIILDSKYMFCMNPKVVLDKKSNIGNLYKYTPEQLEFLRQDIRDHGYETIDIFPTKQRCQHLKLKNLIVQPDIDANFILSHDKHHFKNWYCYAGVDIIHLDHEGNIRYGGACPVSTNSNITDNKYNLPIEPVRCPVKVCYCCDDIECRKSTYVK